MTLSSAFDVCESLMFDGRTLAEREAHVRASFRPVTWADASNGLRRQLERLAGRLTKQAQPQKPIEFGRVYRLYASWVTDPGMLALEVFENYLDQEDAVGLLKGWNWFDIDVNCTWACGPTAELCLLLPADTPSDLVAYIDVIVPPVYQDVRCAVSVDGTEFGHFTGWDLRLLLPLTGLSAGQSVRLTFAFDEPRKPAGADSRYLGLGIRKVAVYPRDDLAGRLRLWEEKGVTEIGE